MSGGRFKSTKRLFVFLIRDKDRKRAAPAFCRISQLFIQTESQKFVATGVAVLIMWVI